MLLVTLFEALLFCLILWFALSQVIIPGIRRRPFFPLFQKRFKKLNEELENINQEFDEKKLKEEINKLKIDLKKPNDDVQ